MSPIAFFFSASSTKTHCQPCELEPVGACSAKSRHSIRTSCDTGLSKLRRLRTERVVVRSSSTERLRAMPGDYSSAHRALPEVAGLRPDLQGQLGEPLGHDGDCATCILDLTADQQRRRR